MPVEDPKPRISSYDLLQNILQKKWTNERVEKKENENKLITRLQQKFNLKANDERLVELVKAKGVKLRKSDNDLPPASDEKDVSVTPILKKTKTIMPAR